MAEHRESRLLPYTCDQLFALVLDIERYPEFVPGYRHGRVLQRQPEALLVEQQIGVGPVQFRFQSHASYTAPSQIHIVASNGPFRRLEVQWEFAAEGTGCRVTVCIRFESRGWLAPVLDGWFARAAPRLLRVFVRRAQQLYGPAHSALN